MGREQRTVADGIKAKPLLERERELASIEDVIDRAEAGEGSLVLIEGPAGIGKTRLLAEATKLATERRLLTRSARGGELERGMPFGVARLLLEPVIERSTALERARLLTGSAGLALAALGREDPERANLERDPIAPIHGLYWLAANLAEHTPCLFAIDDAHWSDRQTLRWLEYMARRLADLAVVVIAGVRTGEPDEPAELEPLRLEGEVLHLAPLSAEAIEELITTELSEPTPEFAAACAEATAGNPLLLAEVLRALRADAIEPAADAAGMIAEIGGESVARYVLVRLARFGDEAVSLARAIAILGAAPQLRHAAALARLERDQAIELCDRLREAEILVPGLPIEFLHPLVRAAIYNDHSEGERASAHRVAARLLAESGASPDQVASHLMACPPDGDQWVVDRLGEAAGEAIRRGGFDSAVAYLERALAEPPADELALRFGLGMSMVQTDLDHAPEVLSDVAERATEQWMRVEALRYTALAHIFGGRWNEAIGWCAKVLDALSEDDREPRLASEALLYCATAGTLGSKAAGFERIEAAAAGATGKTQGECFVRQALGFGRFVECAPVDEVVELAASFPPPPWSLTTLMPIGFGFKVLAWSGRWSEAREAIVRVQEWSREQGLLYGLSYCSAFLAESDRLAGRLADAEGEGRTALQIANELAPSSDFAMEATTNLLTTLIERGDLEEAARLADGVDLSGDVTYGAITPWPLEARGYLRLAQGALAEGVEDLLVIGEELLRRGNANPALSPWCQAVTPALVALDRTAEAQELIAGAEQRARAFGAAHVIGTVLRSRALIEPNARRIETLRESVAALQTYGPPHELARSLLHLGAALRRDRKRSEAREPLRRALELAHRCGAGAVQEYAREELAAAGSRPRSVMRTGVAALTASELRTAKLAAEGLNNREIAERLFVTRRTVETHLTRAYGKLEIKGRNELKAALADDRAPGP